MPTSRADLLVRGASVLPALLLLTACAGTPTLDADPAPSAGTVPAATSPTSTAPTSTSAGPSTPSLEGVPEAMSRALTLRATAVSIHDRRGFMAGLDHADAAFVARQQTYFDAIGRLPAGSTFSGSVLPDTVRHEGHHYRAWVVTTSQIAGFDALPVAGRQVLRFVDDPDHAGEVLLAGTPPPWAEQPPGAFLEPWEDEPVEFRRSHGVLGVFDEASAPATDAVMRSAEAALAEVATEVPYDWSRTVIVYALGTPVMLTRLGDVPGGDPLALDAVSFPLRAADGRLAGTRIAVHPRMAVARGPAAALPRDRLLRHEMVHVAVGEHDDRAPVWLSEGIAEYLSVRSLAPEDRTLSRAAVQAARAGLRGLPTDAGFNGPSHEMSYGVSWWACEAIVDAAGELALWSLLDAYAAAPDGTDPDTVLRQTVGLDGRALAGKAGRLMVAEYAGGRSAS